MGINALQHGHREYSTREGDVQCALGTVVVVGGTREPQTARAEEDDMIHATVLQALDATFNLYGIHYAVENPKTQLGLRLMVLALERSGRLYSGESATASTSTGLCKKYQRVHGQQWRQLGSQRA